METLRALFLEDALYVYAALAAAEVLLIAVWMARRSRRAMILMAVPIVLGIVVAAVEINVVTDRERIVAATEDILEDLPAGRIDRLESRLAEDYVGSGGNRALAIQECRKKLRTADLRDIYIRSCDVDVQGEQARMTLTIYAIGRTQMLLDWHVQWARRDGRWWIVAASLMKTSPAGPGGLPR